MQCLDDCAEDDCLQGLGDFGSCIPIKHVPTGMVYYYAKVVRVVSNVPLWVFQFSDSACTAPPVGMPLKTKSGACANTQLALVDPRDADNNSTVIWRHACGWHDCNPCKLLSHALLGECMASGTKIHTRAYCQCSVLTPIHCQVLRLRAE